MSGVAAPASMRAWTSGTPPVTDANNASATALGDTTSSRRRAFVSSSATARAYQKRTREIFHRGGAGLRLSDPSMAESSLLRGLPLAVLTVSLVTVPVLVLE